MGQIARKYNFAAGTRAKADQVDEEFDQLVLAHNEHDTRLVAAEEGLAPKADLTATNTRVSTLETNSATHTEVAAAVTEAMLGNPPLGGVTNAMLTGGITGEKLAFDPIYYGIRGVRNLGN